MSSTATSVPGLESPVVSAKPKGLVPRSAIWLMIVVLLGGLVVYAIFDISKETKRQRVEAHKAPNTTLGGEPSPDALKKMIADQAAKAPVDASSAPASAPLPEGPAAGGRVALAVGGSRAAPASPVPPEVVGRAATGAPLPGVDIPRSGDRSGDRDANSKAVAAHAEMQARISGSSLVAIDGRGAARQGSGGPAGVVPADDPHSQAHAAQVQALAEAQAGLGQVPGVDAIMKALGTQQRGNTPAAAQGPATRDSAWVKEAADARPAPVTYATHAPSVNLLLQGTRIPAVTLEAVNSDMPGQITARATQDLRDSLTQRTVLVPAGTRFVGSYNAEVSPGQTRVLMAFTRMVLPDGRSVELHASQATDAIGQSGITGDVDNHFLKMYAYSLAVAIGGEKLSNKGVTSGTSLTGQVTSTKTIAGEVLADVSRRILDRNANIPPTITTPVGERIYITITRDIVLAPWKG